MDRYGTRKLLDDQRQRAQSAKLRAAKLSAENERLRAALLAAVEQAHHSDGCEVRNRRDCTCWREPARRLLDTPAN